MSIDSSDNIAAAGDGLIHGLAFSENLKSLHLALLPKVISILGFNIGIELMQMIIMALAFPFLLISRSKTYNLLRIIFASITAIIASLWIIERIFETTILRFP